MWRVHTVVIKESLLWHKYYSMTSGFWPQIKESVCPKHENKVQKSLLLLTLYNVFNTDMSRSNLINITIAALNALLI